MSNLNVVISRGGGHAALGFHRSIPFFVPSVLACKTAVSTVAKKCLEKLKGIANITEGFALATMPFSVIDTCQNAYLLVKGDCKKKIEKTLDIITGVKEAGECTATVVDLCEKFEIASASAISWATPFGAVMTVFSIASMIRNIKTIFKMRKILGEFKSAKQVGLANGKATLETYRSILNFIESKQNKDSDFVSEVFNIDENDFAEALIEKEKEIERKMYASNPEANAILNRAIKSLKGRIQKNIVSSFLTIVSSIINAIGSIIILCCPVIPAGWAIIGISGLIDGGKFIHHKVVEYKFAQEIGFQRKWHEWITC